MSRRSRRVALIASLSAIAVMAVSVWYILTTRRENANKPVPEGVLAELSGHSGPILSCAFSPDSSILATASADETIRIWDTSTFEIKGILVGHTADVKDIAFSPDGKRMLSASWDCSVRVWDTATWQAEIVIDRRPLKALSVAFSPNGTHFAVAGGSGQGSIQVYDCATDQLVWNGAGTGAEIRRLAYSHDGRTIVTADDGGRATLWDEATGRVLDRLQVGAPGLFTIDQVAFGENSSTLIVREHGRISRWDLLTRRLEWEDHAPRGKYTGFARFPDGKFVARMWRDSDGPDGELELLSSVDGHLLGAERCRNSYLAQICFSPDGKYIGTGGELDTCVVRIWDVGKLRAQRR